MTPQHDTSDHSHTIRVMSDVQRTDTRKVPQQKRSREMVERILAAGRTVVLRDGYDAASTNRIAAEAGVSPGSLYQYFPNKDSVLSAIVGRYSDDVAARITAALADRFDETGPEMVRDAGSTAGRARRQRRTTARCRRRAPTQREPRASRGTGRTGDRAGQCLSGGAPAPNAHQPATHGGGMESLVPARSRT